MRLQKFIQTTIREYLNEQQDINNDLNDSFWEWFNGSVALNSNNTPKIYYNGSNKNFNVFKHNKITDKYQNNILTNGLIPTSKKRYNTISKNANYMWKYKELSLWYALAESRDYNKNFDIFEIRQNLNAEEDTTIGVPESYLTTDIILPENITKIDTVVVGDKRLKKFGDIDDVLDMLDIY